MAEGAIGATMALMERPDGTEREPLTPWLTVNAARLVIYLVIASFASSALVGLRSALVVGEATEPLTLETVFWFGVISILYGGLGGLPGAAVWLLILSRLSVTSSVRRRRMIAALTAPPLIGIAWIVLFSALAAEEWLFGYLMAALYGVILPAGSAWVIRLRGTRGDVEARAVAERHAAPGF